jgi:hypothetical protein
MKPLLVMMLLVSTSVHATTECTTRKSGSVTIETCTNSKGNSFTQCRSYMSGGVRKKTCRD